MDSSEEKGGRREPGPARDEPARFSGASDDGTVKATVDRRLDLVAIEISPEAFRQADARLLGAAIVAAVRKAKSGAREARAGRPARVPRMEPEAKKPKAKKPEPAEADDAAASGNWNSVGWNFHDELSAVAPEVIGREHGAASSDDWDSDDWNLRDLSGAADDGNW